MQGAGERRRNLYAARKRQKARVRAYMDDQKRQAQSVFDRQTLIIPDLGGCFDEPTIN